MAELRLPFNSDDNIDYGNPLADKLFFANVPHVSVTKDLVSKTEASVVSSLSKMVGEFYVQDELVTLDPTRWDIAYPYSALGALDNSSYSMMWRIKMHTVPQSGTAAFLFRWGNNEFHLRRNGQKIELSFGGSGYVYTSENLADGQIITLALTRNSSDYVVKTYLDGVEVKSYASFSYTTFNNASYIEYHGEADQRGEGFAAVYVWVDRTLTPSEIVDLTENPYQLLEPSQLSTTEYCISLPTANDKVTIPLSGAYTGTTELTDGTQTPISGTGTYTIDGTVAKRIKKITVTDTNGLHVYYFDLTEPQYSTNKAVNGTFDTDTSWDKTGGCTVSGGVGHVDGTGSASLLYQNMLVQGRKYKVEFDVTNHVAGTTVVWNNDGTTLYTITGNGHVSFTFTHAIANGNFIFRANAASYDVDNVVVQEVVVNSLTSNLAANLAGSPVFEVIVPVVEVDVGAGQTYVDADAAAEARKNLGAGTLQRIKVHGITTVGVTVTYDPSLTRIELIGITPWTDRSQPPVNGIVETINEAIEINPTVASTSDFLPFRVKDLYLKSDEDAFLSYFYSKRANIEIEDCDLVSTGGNGVYSKHQVTTEPDILTIKRSRIKSFGSAIYIYTCENALIEELLVTDCNGYGGAGGNYSRAITLYSLTNGSAVILNSVISMNLSTAGSSVYNGLIQVDNGGNNLSVINLVTNVPSTDFIPSAGGADMPVVANITYDAPISTWLTAGEVINQTGQAALTGKGWNGSDLLKEFWATVGLTRITKSFGTVTDLLQRENKSFNTVSDLLERITKYFNTVTNFGDIPRTVKIEQTTASVGLPTGMKDITIAGFGTPKAAIVYATFGTAGQDTLLDNASVAIAYTDGINSGGNGFYSQNNVNPSNINTDDNSTKLVSLLTSAGYTFIANFDSWITDGIRLNFVGGNDSAQLTVVLIGGDGVTGVKVGSLTTTSSPQTISNVGFESDLIIASTISQKVSTNISFAYGYATKQNTKNKGVFIEEIDNVIPTKTRTYSADSNCVGKLVDTTVVWQGGFNNYTSSGFNFNWTGSAGSAVVRYIALKFASNVHVDLDFIDAPTVQYFTEAGLSSPPEAIFINSGGNTLLDTVQNGAGFSTAVLDKNGIGNHTASLADNSTPSVVKSLVSQTKLEFRHNGFVQSQGTFTGLTSDGFSLDMTIAVASKWLRLAIGEVAGLGRVTKTFGVLSNLLQRGVKYFNTNTDMNQRVNDSFTVSADLLQRETKTFTTVTDLLERITLNYQVLTDLLQRDTKSFNVLVNANQRDTKSFNTSVDLLQRVNKNFITVVNMLAGVGVRKAFNINVDLLQRVDKSFTTVTDLLQRENMGFDTVTDLLQREVKTFSTVTDLLQRETFDFIVNTDFLARVNKSFVVSTSMLQSNRVRKGFTVSVDLIGRVTKQFSAEVDLLNRVTKHHELVATLLNRVTIDFITRTNLTGRVTKDFTVSVDTIERVGKVFNVKVRLDSGTIPAHYVIAIDGTVDFNKPSVTATFITSTKKIII